MAVIQTLTLKETEVLASSNSSKVRILWRSTQSGESWNGYTRTAKYYVSINGGAETEYSVSYTLPQNSTAVIVDTTIVVSHKPDGTGSIIVRTWMDTGISAGVVEEKAKKTLTAIPRATTIDSLECSTEYLNGVITAKYTPKVVGYYNCRIINVNVNGILKHVHTKDLGQISSVAQQNHTMQFSSDELAIIYAAVKTTTNATIRVTFRTFVNFVNGHYTAQIGSDQSREIVLKIPDSVAPTAELIVNRVNSNAWIADKDIYVAGLSGVTATLNVTPSAGIKDEELTTTITYDGATYNARTLNVTTLKKSGGFGFVAKVTDPRGRSATATKSITVLPYSAPAITSIQIERGNYADGEWIAADEGQDIRAVFKSTLSLAGYDNVYSVAFKIDGRNQAPNHGATTELTTGAEHTVYFLGVNGEASHTFVMTVTDCVGSTGNASLTIPTIHITIEFNDSGKGIAFGKTSEKDAFECAWDAEFSGSLAKKLPDNSLLEIDDTGWISMGTSSSVSTGTDTGRNGPGCYYRVINKRHVYVVFNAGFTFSGSAITVNGTALPTELRPKRKAYAMNLVSGRAFARTGVNISGNVVIDWVQNIASAAPTESASTTWIDGYVDYWI